MSAIVASGLTTYYGRTPGVVDLDMEVAEGEIFGFLGPNGAGKTTTIRTLMDLLRPTRGSVTILGLDSHRDSIEIKARTGYLPGELTMWPDMTGRQLLEYMGSLRRADVTVAMDQYAKRLDVDLDRKVGAYSSGNRQKIGVIQAFMHQPELLILDEPSAGLDPLMQQEFYRMVDEVRADGRTIFLSSHILPEVERVADRVGIVRHGRLVAVERVEDLKAKALRRIEFLFATPVQASEFIGIEGVDSAVAFDHGNGVTVTVTGSLDRVMKTASRHEIINVISHEGDLETAFLEYYREGANAG